MAKCLILGADGFIGSHLTDGLLAAGHRVRAFDRLPGGSARNLVDASERLELRSGNFMDEGDLDRALEGMEYVFHLVSTTNPASSASDPLVDVDTNLHMSVKLFELCVKHQVKRVIFASSGGALYGQDLDRPLREIDPTEPVSPYGVGKLAIEGYLRFFEESAGLDYLALRIANPYGVRQNIVGSQGVIPIFLNLIRQDKPLTVYGDGGMVRDYLYISDLTRMLVAIFDKPAKFHTYNIGSGRGVTVTELIKDIEAVVGREVHVQHVPSRPTDINYVLLDTARYAAEFGEPPQTRFEDGIRQTWEYVQEKGAQS